MTDTGVLVIGAGPSGLLAALLLARRGVEVVVTEREADVTSEPRAVSIDDEAMRTLHHAGVLPLPASVLAPGLGTTFYGARGQRIVQIRPGNPTALGYPGKNPVDHAGLLRALLAALHDLPTASVRFQTDFLEARQDADRVLATVRDGSGQRASITARYVIGADGGRSSVRRAISASMTGESFAEQWLVVDCLADPHDARFSMQHGDPARPYVIVPGIEGRCRYEFMLLSGEDPERIASLDALRELVEPLRGELREEHIVRRAVYTFRALVADRWRDGRILLVGDAAHLMPPFAAQGLNSAIRDVANLTWKLALVLAGDAGQALLDSYEQERRPHTAATVRASRRIGQLMTLTSGPRAGARDLALQAAMLWPPLRRRLTGTAVRPPARHSAGVLAGATTPLTGAPLPQPRVITAQGHTVDLDQLLGGEWALLAVAGTPDSFTTLNHPLWERLRPSRTIVELGERFPRSQPAPILAAAGTDGQIDQAFADYRDKLILARPDRYVAAVFAPAQADTVAGELSRLIAPTPIEPSTSSVSAPQRELLGVPAIVVNHAEESSAEPPGE